MYFPFRKVVLFAREIHQTRCRSSLSVIQYNYTVLGHWGLCLFTGLAGAFGACCACPFHSRGHPSSPADGVIREQNCVFSLPHESERMSLLSSIPGSGKHGVFTATFCLVNDCFTNIMSPSSHRQDEGTGSAWRLPGCWVMKYGLKGRRTKRWPSPDATPLWWFISSPSFRLFMLSLFFLKGKSSN